MRIHFRREDARRSARFGHGNREQPDRAAARNGHGLGGNRPRQHRVHRVAQWVEQRSVVVRDRRRELPDIRFRNDGVAGESAVGIHAQDADVLAHVRQACAALQALAAGHVHLRAHQVALVHCSHAASQSRPPRHETRAPESAADEYAPWPTDPSCRCADRFRKHSQPRRAPVLRRVRA